MLSFYDWYADLPPASPQIWGEQTDVPESSDWYNILLCGVQTYHLHVHLMLIYD